MSKRSPAGFADPSSKLIGPYSVAGILALSLIGLLLACGSDQAGACVAGLSNSCAPLYDPTYAQIFERTLKPVCAQAGGACHAMDGARGGLVLEDPDQAYRLLLGQDGARARVIPGNAACSLIVERLESQDSSFMMPPGAPRPEAERCAIRKWIAAGAAR